MYTCCSKARCIANPAFAGTPSAPVVEVNIVLLQAAFIELVESLVHERARSQVPEQAVDGHDPPPYPADCVVWDETQRNGLSEQALEMLESAKPKTAEILKMRPENSQYRAKILKSSKNMKLPQGVAGVHLPAGHLDCAAVFNSIQKHGASQVCFCSHLSKLSASILNAKMST